MLVVLEGIDGSGKGTQTKLLQQRAAAEHLSAIHISFPQYGLNPFAKVVGEYLNGRFGDLDAVHPKLSSLLFAGDRFASKTLVQDALHTYQLVICDRYVSSNFAHQAAKLPLDEREEFVDWMFSIEFGVYGLPKPDLNIFLDVPVAAARKLVDRKTERSHYTTLKADIHENNVSYLAECRAMYQYLVANDIAGPWETVDCMSGNGDELLSMTEISNRLWGLVCARLG